MKFSIREKFEFEMKFLLVKNYIYYYYIIIIHSRNETRVRETFSMTIRPKHLGVSERMNPRGIRKQARISP